MQFSSKAVVVAVLLLANRLLDCMLVASDFMNKKENSSSTKLSIAICGFAPVSNEIIYQNHTLANYNFYARLHGYHHIVEIKKILNKKDYWNKIRILQNTLKHYD